MTRSLDRPISLIALACAAAISAIAALDPVLTDPNSPVPFIRAPRIELACEGPGGTQTSLLVWREQAECP